MRATTVLLVGLFLIAAVPAEAATVWTTADCGKEDCAYYVVFRAAPGERNAVTTEQPEPYTVIVRDTGAPLTPGRGCQAQADGSVRCVNGSWPSVFGVDVYLGDGDDVASGGATFHGEAGDDRITGNGGGGPGDDVLMHQHGFFLDDDGATRGHDVYRSWSGTGIVSYESRRNTVLADLRPGAHSEDRLEGIREVRGGMADDVLIGDGAPNTLNGGPGKDRLVGNAGDDWLISGRSDDRPRPEVVDAGPGDDRIEAGAGAVDVRCGAGTDKVKYGGVLRADCEFAGAGFSDQLVRVRGALPSPGSAILIGALGRWSARLGDELVGSLPTRGAPADLRLNAKGRRLLRRHRQLVLTIGPGAGRGPGFGLRVRWAG